MREFIVSQGTSGCGKDDVDDASSDDEWIDISHSSEDDAEENIGTQQEVFDRLEDDQKCDHGAVDENEEDDGDKVSSLMQDVTERCYTTYTYQNKNKSSHQHVFGNI